MTRPCTMGMAYDDAKLESTLTPLARSVSGFVDQLPLPPPRRVSQVGGCNFEHRQVAPLVHLDG
jgi:hypothetical protein